MTRDDIARMAREAGLVLGYPFLPVHLERFAALVASATSESIKAGGWRACAVGQRTTQHCGLLETAVLDEREACARLAEEWLGPTKDRELHIAAAIRARGE